MSFPSDLPETGYLEKLGNMRTGRALACPVCYWEWWSRAFDDWAGDLNKMDRCPKCGIQSSLFRWIETAEQIGADNDSGDPVGAGVDTGADSVGRGVLVCTDGLAGPLAATGQQNRPGGLLAIGRCRLAAIPRAVWLEVALIVATALIVWAWS